MAPGLRLLVVCLLAGSWLPAAGAAAPEPPPAPESRVLDEARVFDPGQTQEMSSLLHEAATAGIDFYVLTLSFSGPEPVERVAERHRAAWCRSGFGLVMAYERGSQGLTFSASPGGSMSVSAPELEAIFHRSQAAAAGAENPGDQLLAIVRQLLPELRQKVALQQKLQREHITLEQWIIYGGAAAFLLLAFLFFLCLRRLLHVLKMRRSQPCWFPPVQVASRFGAPYGGGVVAEIDSAP